LTKQNEKISVLKKKLFELFCVLFVAVVGFCVLRRNYG